MFTRTASYAQIFILINTKKIYIYKEHLRRPEVFMDN